MVMEAGYEYTYGDTLLQVSDVSLVLGGRQILKGVNVEVKDVKRPGLAQGQVVGLLGPSGVGKTQLFKILAGINKPTTGSVLVTKDKVPVEVGMVRVVEQNYPLFAHRTVMSNMLIAGRQSGMKVGDATTKAKQLLERFVLSDRANAWPAELSGGQRQRVAIAQQLMCGDNLILMDEPFSGLDPIMKDEACRLINDVAGTSELTTIIVVTHDISASIQVADTLWLMGRERAADGSIIPGASIRPPIDLMERGLAWHQHVRQLPAFADCVSEVRDIFPTL